VARLLVRLKLRQLTIFALLAAIGALVGNLPERVQVAFSSSL
jgi:hypothetical protein